MTFKSFDCETLSHVVDAAIKGRTDVDDVLLWPHPIYVALRRKGLMLRELWRDEDDLLSLFRNLRHEVRFGDADSIELCLTYNYRQVSPDNVAKVFSNMHRGIRGIEIHIGDQLERHAPTKIISSNRDFPQVIHNFASNIKMSQSELDAADSAIRSFDSRQFLVKMKSGSISKANINVIEMFRGNRIVELEDINATTIAGMIATMGRWMVNNVNDDGQMLYKYWPSRGEYAPSNNTIRQFMATLCLIRLAKHTGITGDMDTAGRNLNYNLQQFFKADGHIGTIEYEGKAKLGAAALAAMSIMEYPDKSRHQDTFEMLSKGVEALWSKDGSFVTFHKPVGRNDNQNFYPGEALLFWANLYAHDKNRAKDSPLLEKCLKSFAYYRDWHRDHKNPAFVPWHTQAYALLYAATAKRELLDFIFEMNDWLLPMQQWDNVPYADLKGRFYDAKHPEYGPPHASSTGVYMEGLTDAYKLALDDGDGKRASRYKKALWRSLRNIRQLQFIDDVDMYYTANRPRVAGALRTNAYNNEIRVDNVQHPLIALLKLSKIPEFAAT